MSEPVKRFVVERAKWIRGAGTDAVRLLRPADGHMCCLGFVCEQLGVERADFTDVGRPMYVASSGRVKIAGVLLTAHDGIQTDLATSAIKINDRVDIDDATREKELTALFASEGLEMVFV